MRRLRWTLVLVLSQSGCVTEPSHRDLPDAVTASQRMRAVEKLDRIGLTVTSDASAWLPDGERDDVIPCRAHATEYGAPPVPPHPAGYLIVGFDGEIVPDRDRIWSALVAWEPGTPLTVRIRRNPHRQTEEAWWQVDVPLNLPE